MPSKCTLIMVILWNALSLFTRSRGFLIRSIEAAAYPNKFHLWQTLRWSLNEQLGRGEHKEWSLHLLTRFFFTIFLDEFHWFQKMLHDSFYSVAFGRHHRKCRCIRWLLSFHFQPEFLQTNAGSWPIAFTRHLWATKIMSMIFSKFTAISWFAVCFLIESFSVIYCSRRSNMNRMSKWEWSFGQWMTRDV